MNKITSMAKLVIFLLWHDKSAKKILKWLLPLGFAAILGIWQFPFQNLSWTGILESETQIKIRMILTGATIVFVILSLTYILHGRYRKYKQTHKLTDEELENVLKHMNESS